VRKSARNKKGERDKEERRGKGKPESYPSWWDAVREKKGKVAKKSRIKGK